MPPRQVADERENLRLSADVEAAHGMVEDEDFRALRDQPFGQDDLLLVAAAQVGRRRLGDGVLTRSLSIQRDTTSLLAPRIEEGPRMTSGKCASVMFSLTLRPPMIPSMRRSAGT